MNFYLFLMYSSFFGLFYAINDMNERQLESSVVLEELDTESQRTNSSRMLPFFQRPSLLNIVRFPNEECFDVSNQSGTCYTPLECKKLGGIPSSPCARGLGACCIVSRSCHNTTSNKVVYFKNPSYPQSDSVQNFCDLSVNIYDTDVCQLRVDFLDFQLDQPTLGNCLGDKLRISSSGFAPTSIPILCGLNRNQHIYVNLPRVNTDRTTSVVFETNSVGDYRWHVRITQIDCNFRNKKNLLSDRNARFVTYGPNGPSLSFLTTPHPPYSLPAPMGCLQYYTQTTGTVESFNFGEYLNNLDYAICIERQPSTCRVIYTAADYLFNIDTPTGALLQKDMSGVGDNVCSQDYLTLPGSSQTGDDTNIAGQFIGTFDRYCGGRLNWLLNSQTDSPVISKANGPIVLRFHSDAVQRDPLYKDGFRLRYEQSSTDCMQLLPLTQNQLNPYGPNPVVANLVANTLGQYYDKHIANVELEKQEPFVYMSKREPHVRSNGKQMKL